MTENVERIQKRLLQEGDKVCAYFGRLSPAEWEQQVYLTGGAWRVREVLAHFVTAERGYLHYMRDTIAGGAGVPRDFDIDAFNESQVPALDGLSGPELIAALRRAREETVAFVGSLAAADLQIVGYHPWFGEGTLGFMLKLMYRHPMLHLRDVRQALASGNPLADGEGYTRFAGEPDSQGGE